MLIGIDLDSVLAHIMLPLNRFHADKYGTQLKVSDYTEYDLSYFWSCKPKQALERLFEFYNSTYMDEIPLMPGAAKGISYLRQNHTLAVITSRPHSTETKTLNWLNQHFPDTFSHIILSNQVSHEGNKAKTKAEIGLELGIEAMIDDHIDYVENCSQNGIPSYLFDAPWNRHKTVSQEIIRIHGWNDIQNHF